MKTKRIFLTLIVLFLTLGTISYIPTPKTALPLLKHTNGHAIIYTRTKTPLISSKFIDLGTMYAVRLEFTEIPQKLLTFPSYVGMDIQIELDSTTTATKVKKILNITKEVAQPLDKGTLTQAYSPLFANILENGTNIQIYETATHLLIGTPTIIGGY